jgi:sigma-B regulation protein RsbU (phosphoserine phosphatase)
MSDALASPTTNADTPVLPRCRTHPGAGGMLCALLGADKIGQIQGLFAQSMELQLSFSDDAVAGQAPSDGLLEQHDAQGRSEYVAPVYIDGALLGSIHIQSNARTAPCRDVRAGAQVAYHYVVAQARACVNAVKLEQHETELSALFELSTMLAGHRSVAQLLGAAARSAAQVMKVKAASIRLLRADAQEMIPEAVYNLSQAYLEKGPILLQRSELAQRALAGEVVYVQDMASDRRVLYPEDAKREGLVSILSAGMIHQGEQIGVIRLYTGVQRSFSALEQNLLRAIAQIMAAAIVNARLHAETLEAHSVQRQLKLAADVQRRMLPGAMPHLPPFDIAAQFVPSLELGGDFFDFIQLDGHMGIALGDVVGKGIAASLLMASVRASLRAYAQDLYDIDEVIARVNSALVRDTLTNEFATLFYGVIDPATRRLTYCNAGHEPPMLLRGNDIQYLGVGGMIVGVDSGQRYDKAIVDLLPGDMLLIYSDGLSEAMNFEGELFAKRRIIDAMRQTVDMSAAVAIKHILWQMYCFTGLKRHADDTTVVLIKVGN